MRILILTNRVPFPPNDGGNIATYYLLRYLKERGHELTLLSLNTRKHHQNTSPLTDIAEVHAVDIDTDIRPVKLMLNLFKKLPYNAERFYSAQFSDKLREVLQKETFDIVQLEGLYMSLYLPVVRQYSKAKVVLRAHNVEHEIWQGVVDNEKSLLKKWYLKQMVRKLKNMELSAMEELEGILTLTGRDRDFFTSAGYTGKTAVVPSGVELHEDRSRVAAEEQPMSAGFIGSLDWIPNLHGLRWFINEVWPVVLQFLPQAQLHIAGKNAPEGFPGNIGGQNVIFHGMVPDAHKFMEQMQVIVVPLFSGGGMRIKVAEAMALGKAVVATSKGAEGLDVTSGLNIRIADEAPQFAQDIAQLILKFPLRARTGEEAKIFARQHFDWRELVVRVENFYRELL